MPEGGVARMERVLELAGRARTSSLDLFNFGYWYKCLHLVKRELTTRLGSCRNLASSPHDAAAA